MKKPIWVPSQDRVSDSNMTSFMRYVEKLIDKRVGNYNELYSWSIENIEEFWKSIWVMAGIIHSKPYHDVLSEYLMPGARWFEGAELNFAENLLRFNDDRTAVISIKEGEPEIRLTYNELYRMTAKCADGLKKLGVTKGDPVAGYITNIPEAIIAMLAATSIGAIWSSCSPDFGIKGVLDRFEQIRPKVLFAIERYQYNGQKIDCTEKIKLIAEGIPGLQNVIVISPDEESKLKHNKNNSGGNPRFIDFNQLINNTADKIKFEQLPFDYPVYIMYSSGTTGKPKCIVHGAGGTLLQHFKELSLHTNLTRNDIITYYTTCGWMMWNWLVSSLNIGATILLYDGSPVYPNAEILWKKIEEEKITVFGTSPKFLSLCEKTNLVPKNSFNLGTLKTVLSTGSPLSEENFKWVYENVKDDLLLSSISGGTDIISCFMLGNPNLPVYPEEIQCRGLGMKVEAFDENGFPVIDKKGELVCTAPFPSMPVFFWDDPDNKKYLSAYFEQYPGVWRHGDYIKITGNGTVVVYGRSDSTLNPGGVRIGTAELYNIAESLDYISDSIAVGQSWNGDTRIILFVVLKANHILSDAMVREIKEEIRRLATPRHVPAKIVQVSDIPRTISGKKVELAVSRLLNNQIIDNKDAIANPDSLEEFKNLIPLLTV